jgi:hypothetical protein
MKKNRLLWILTASSVQVPTLYSFRYLLHEPGLDYIPVLGGSWLLWRTSGSGSLRIFRIVPVLVSALVSVLEIWPSSHFSWNFISVLILAELNFCLPWRNYLENFLVPVLEPGPAGFNSGSRTGSIWNPVPIPVPRNQTQLSFGFGSGGSNRPNRVTAHDSRDSDYMRESDVIVDERHPWETSWADPRLDSFFEVPISAVENSSRHSASSSSSSLPLSHSPFPARTLSRVRFLRSHRSFCPSVPP